MLQTPRCSTPRHGTRRGLLSEGSPILAGLLLALALAGPAEGGPSPSAAATPPTVTSLEEMLLQANAAGHLPLGFALGTAARLRVHLHEVKGFDPASFARRPIPLLEAVKDGITTLPEEVPTLYLYAPTYRQDGSWVAILDQTVDVSEYLFNALILAYLELREVSRDTAYAATIGRRADQILGAVPPEHRQEAYFHAVADFGSHALSAANQLERSARRHSRRGTDLCQHLDRRASLFGLWERIFGDGFYQARYFEPTQGQALTGQWVDTGVGLAREDKRLFMEAVFQGFWSGEKGADLARRYCPGSH